MNERVVEVPWCTARLQGRTLDVGAAESEYLDSLPTGSYAIDLRPAQIRVPEHVTYQRMNSAALAFPNNFFDTVLCLSTFEHLGRAHDAYGTSQEIGIAEWTWQEMWRVLKPGGRLILTLPYGKHEDHGWFINYDHDDVKYFGEPQEAAYFAAPHWEQVDPRTLTETRYRPHEGRAGAVACFLFLK